MGRTDAVFKSLTTTRLLMVPFFSPRCTIAGRGYAPQIPCIRAINNRSRQGNAAYNVRIGVTWRLPAAPVFALIMEELHCRRYPPSTLLPAKVVAPVVRTLAFRRGMADSISRIGLRTPSSIMMAQDVDRWAAMPDHVRAELQDYNDGVEAGILIDRTEEVTPCPLVRCDKLVAVGITNGVRKFVAITRYVRRHA